MVLGLLDSGTLELGVGAGHSESLEHGVLLLFGGDSSGGFLGGEDVVLSDGELWDLGGGGELFGGRVTLTGLASLSWEDDELGSVFLQSGDVGLETFNGLVSSSEIDGNAELSGFSDRESSALELIGGEASSSSDSDVVSCSLASYNWSKSATSWSWGDGSSLVLSGSLSSLLSGGLVEPGSDSSLPVLVEVGVGQNVVSFANHGFLVRALKSQKISLR